MYRRIIIGFEERKRILAMKFVFGKGFLTIFQKAKKLQEIARVAWFNKRVGTCFYAWSDHIYLVSLGLDRKRWSGPRKYEVCHYRSITVPLTFFIQSIHKNEDKCKFCIFFVILFHRISCFIIFNIMTKFYYYYYY